MLEQKNVTVKAGSSFQTVCPFPVGYIYQSYSSTSPANIYGGSWTSITGRFLYCNSGTSVGGSNTHKLSIDEMPKHNHAVDILMANNQGSQYLHTTYWGPHKNVTAFTQHTGGSAAHNNMPAYQTCYAWRRTA